MSVEAVEAPAPAVADFDAAQRGHPLQPRIPEDSPIAVFIRAHAFYTVVPPQTDWVPLNASPLIENQVVAQPIISDFKPQTATASHPLWSRRGIEEDLEGGGTTTALSPPSGKHDAESSAVSAWAIFLTLVIAIGVVWMVWFGPQTLVIRPVKRDIPSTATTTRSEKKTVTKPVPVAKPEEIRKAHAAEPVLSPSDISAR